MIQDIQCISANPLKRSRGTAGSVWQHQFWDRFVRHAKEFRERRAYLHLNPVRKGLVAKPEDWPWSSYNHFALDKTVVARCPIQVAYTHLPETYRG